MSASAHFASWCCTTVFPLPNGPGTAATPPFAMWKSHEPKNAKLVKKYGTDITRFSFASTPLLAAGAVEVAQPVATVDSVEETVVDKEVNKNESSKKKAKKAGNSEPIRYRRKK